MVLGYSAAYCVECKSDSFVKSQQVPYFLGGGELLACRGFADPRVQRLFVSAPFLTMHGHSGMMLYPQTSEVDPPGVGGGVLPLVSLALS